MEEGNFILFTFHFFFCSKKISKNIFFYFFSFFRTSGIVYRATDSRTNEKVAIKEMILEEQPNKEIIINEILLMRDCNHRTIVNYIDSYLVDGALWVVMEYVDGCDLTQVVEVCHPMKEEHIAAITHEVLSGLEHLHQKGIIHRDIKSDNVMVAKNGRLKLSKKKKTKFYIFFVTTLLFI